MAKKVPELNMEGSAKFMGFRISFETRQMLADLKKRMRVSGRKVVEVAVEQLHRQGAITISLAGEGK